MAREVPVEAVGVASLVPVVELLADRARELVDHLARVDEVEHPHALFRESRRLVHQLEVGFDLARRVRPLHFDGNAAPVREHGAVNLADRRRGERLGLELEEEPLDRLPELFSDHTLDLGERDRPHVVLEPAQLGDDVRRDDVGSRREQLAELDERRAELVEHFAQMPATRGRGAVIGRTTSATLEDVAEAVPHGDLGDLAQPPDVQLFRARGHGAVLHADGWNPRRPPRRIRAWSPLLCASNRGSGA